MDLHLCYEKSLYKIKRKLELHQFSFYNASSSVKFSCCSDIDNSSLLNAGRISDCKFGFFILSLLFCTETFTLCIKKVVVICIMLHLPYHKGIAVRFPFLVPFIYSQKFFLLSRWKFIPTIMLYVL